MSKRNDQVSLGDMLSHASEAVKLLGTTSRKTLGKKRVVQRKRSPRSPNPRS